MYDCSDDHTSELAKMARKETAFPLWRATESRWKRNMVSSVTELMRMIIIIIIIRKEPVLRELGVLAL